MNSFGLFNHIGKKSTKVSNFSCSVWLWSFFFDVSKLVGLFGEKFNMYTQWPSSPGIFHILLGKFACFIIRFLLDSFIVKSDNGRGLFWNRKQSDYRWTRPMFYFVSIIKLNKDPFGVNHLYDINGFHLDLFHFNFSFIYISN